MTERVTEVWLENRRGCDALGIDETRPRLSWIATGAPDAFEVQFARRGREVERTQVIGSRLVDWPFEQLHARQDGWLRVRPIDSDGWSDPLLIEAGPGDDWRADFVSPDPGPHANDEPRPAYLLRARFSVDTATLGKARVHVSAHGLYELEVNGVPLGDALLSPGWSSYRHRLTSRTYDLTPLLVPGPNTIGAWLADGWYRGHIGFDGGVWDAYGCDVSLLAQLELTDADGRLEVLDLNDAWQWRPSPITATGLYEGETYDARLLPAGWSSGAPGDDWRPAVRLPRTSFTGALQAPTGPPVRVTDVLRPVAISPTVDGRIRLDFGQNIAGKLRIRTTAPAGHTIRLHHAEVLEDDRLAVRPLREATSVDTFVAAGAGVEEWTPRFTYHGFRYAELENWPGDLHPGDVEALVTHSDLRRTGWFECSDPRLNQLHSNVVWSMRDNFVDLPTDCPQRDERLGWTGDIQVFAPTALYLFAAHGTLTGWLRDLAAEQGADGQVPNFVPWVPCGFPDFPTAAWGDAAVIVPWEMYSHDGDTRVLADQYDSMCRWVDLVDRLTGHTGLWNEGFQLGDWLDPAAPPESPGDSHTDRYLVATAYHARTASIMADVAGILGRASDRERFATIADRARRAFQDEFVAPNGRVVSDTVTSLALALQFDLLPGPGAIARARTRLSQLVRAAEYRVSTGFIGTPIVCDALACAGDADGAYRLLLQEQLPSWLYPITMGATTVWERWDSMLPDGSVNPGTMTSFNHYALGAIADFLHRRVAGLGAASPGWTEIDFCPLPGGGLTYASARHDTPLGEAACGWRRDGDTLLVTVRVPRGATGVLRLPGRDPVVVSSGDHAFSHVVTDTDASPRRPATPALASPDGRSAQ